MPSEQPSPGIGHGGMPWRKAWFESPMKMETTVEREWKWLTRNLSCGERSAVWRGLVRLLDVATYAPPAP